MMLQSSRLTKRSMDMTSDSGLIRQDTDAARHIQEVLDELHQMQQTPRLVTSPEELETLEREIRQRTDQLGSLLVGYHLQQALDSPALQAEQDLLVRQLPKPLTSGGKVQVRIRPAPGHPVAVWTTYYRRKGQRRAGTRSGVVRRGESVGGDVRLSARGPGRAGHPGRGVGHQNGAADRLPLSGPRQAGATDRAHGV